MTSALQAAGIDGAWANRASDCAKIFRKSRNGIVVGSSSEAFGKWFILEGDRIRGHLASCRINLRKQDGPVVHLIASCKSSIAIQDVQFTLQAVGDDKLKQIFPGVPELEIEYQRCTL